MSEPLVTCIMPTRDRRAFVPRAIAWFRRQDHPLKELVIVDDGDDPVADLVPVDSRVRYIRLDRRASIGHKRNLACGAARGEIVLHWDDDDWYSPDRIRRQLAVLRASGADICGANALRFYDPGRLRAWHYRYPADQPHWVHGATLAYRRAFWQDHRFDDLDVGEDAYFVWRAAPDRVAVIDDGSFYLGAIHPANASPKQTHGAYWQPCPVELVERQLGADLEAFAHPPASPAAPRPAGPVRNVHACLVHENPACVLDLVRNLRHCDPASQILLYDGSATGALLGDRAAFERAGAVVHPAPRPMRWGYLHEFAFDAMRFALDELGAEALTVVDSDQLALRPGYAGTVDACLRAHPRVGLLGTSAEVQGWSTRIAPAVQAWREVERWRPFLRKFARGEEQFVRWTFWPSTVFAAPAMRDLVALRERDADLAALLAGSSMWAVEEVLFPTLVALLGHEVARNPCSPELVRYRIPASDDELRRAFDDPSIYWIHPVERQYGDPLRTRIRAKLDGYGCAVPARAAAPAPLRTLPILARMREVEGWFGEDEADALIALAADAVRARGPATRIVEVGSFRGRATVVLASVAQALDPGARVYAIDPHDGRLGARDGRMTAVQPSAGALAATIARYGLDGVVVQVHAAAAALDWNEPVDLLLVDGLHDYAGVESDFARFRPYLRPGARVAFHDYCAEWPGVRAFVDALCTRGGYRFVELVDTLAIVESAAARTAATG